MPDFNFMKEIKAFHHCVRCGKRIPLIWNERDRIFDGEYMALDSVVSPVFEVFVPKIGSIVCNDCFSNTQKFR